MSCFHKQVQTGFSTPLLKRKSAGARDSWEVFLTEKKETHTHTHPWFSPLNTVVGYDVTKRQKVRSAHVGRRRG